MWTPRLLLLGLAALSPRRAAPLPRFTWDHMTTFAHCSNTSGPLSAAALQAFRNHSW